jgi:hypothetical protein
MLKALELCDSTVRAIFGVVDQPTHEAVFESKPGMLASTEIPTPVADRIGMPLIACKLSLAVVWRDPRRPCRVKPPRQPA